MSSKALTVDHLKHLQTLNSFFLISFIVIFCAEVEEESSNTTYIAYLPSYNCGVYLLNYDHIRNILTNSGTYYSLMVEEEV